MAKTYEELLAAQTELVHFNPYHDSSNGQFTNKSGTAPNISKRKMKKAYIEAHNKMADRMNNEEGEKIRAKKLSVEEHNKQWIETQNRILDEELRKATQKYSKKEDRSGKKALTNRQKTKIRNAVIAGAAVATGSFVINKTLTSIGSAALNEAGVPIELKPSALAIGGKFLKTGLIAYGGMTLTDMYKSHKKNKKTEG